MPVSGMGAVVTLRTMKLRCTLHYPDRSSIDIAVSAGSAATIGEVADAILERDPKRTYLSGPFMTGQVTLEVTSLANPAHPQVLDPSETVADLALANGVLISVVPVKRVPKTPVAYVEVVSDGRRRQYEVPRGASTLGRDESNDIVLDDPTVSKFHARVHVASAQIDLVDLSSANGVVVQGQPVPKLELQGGQQALLGSTLVSAGFLAHQPTSHELISGRVITRSPSVETRYIGKEIEGIDPPIPSDPQPVPWLAMVVPLIAGTAMYLVTRSMLSIVFVALSPALMLGTWWTAVSTKRKKDKIERARFNAQLARLDTRLAREHEQETALRTAESPSLEEVYSAVLNQGSRVWKLRPEHRNFTHLRLGVGTLPSRTSDTPSANLERAAAADVAAIEAVSERYRSVFSVPIIENLDDAGAIGVCGSVEHVAWYARGVAAQIAATRSPEEFVICGVFGPAWRDEFHALKWLPHVTNSDRVFAGMLPLADNAIHGTQLLTCLEDMLSQRSLHGSVQPMRLGDIDEGQSARRDRGQPIQHAVSESAGVPLPCVVVFISDDAPVPRARLIQLLEHSAGRSVYPIWMATNQVSVPAACRTFVQLDDRGRAQVGFVRSGTSLQHLQPEGMQRDQMLTFAQHLAAYVDAGTLQTSASEVPERVSLLTLIGEELAVQHDAVKDRWRQNGTLIDSEVSAIHVPSKLRAIVGQAAGGAMHLDLRAQGPHALVGGTTGSGKSEFLQAWLLGMAIEYSPQRVSFLLIDYKGGAAFGECVKLPHCVGLVTDLNPHLVRRVLISLRAELRVRERLFARKQVKDLLELETRGDPDAPPALVIIIDEFAALAKEIPEFVDGVVDVAQRGRSLGIHLIMATQRPSGVIRENLRANTNLRVALRMADGSDSEDVLGHGAAADFNPELPGRAAVKTGPGRPSIFQSAFTGSWHTTEQHISAVQIETFHIGATEQWVSPLFGTEPHTTHKHLGPNDQQRLVRNISLAARQLRCANPRRPWLDSLADTYDLADLSPHTEARLVLGVSDVPERQLQESVYFDPDSHGHLAVFGAGGSGKSTTLRTLATAAGMTLQGGLFDVYGLDFGAGGLHMLADLPHIGAVIARDSCERVRNLFKMLKAELLRRTEAYSKVNADTILQYRELTGEHTERRILLLVDGFPAFREEYEGASGQTESYEVFQHIMRDGRSLGMHVALSSDRGQSVPSTLQAHIQQRIVLRMNDSDGYTMLGAPRDVLDVNSVAGRAVIDGVETQIATAGGTSSISEQAAVTNRLARTLEQQGRQPAPPVRVLPELCTLDDLPTEIAGCPVLGLSELDLGPIAFDPRGLFIIAGAPGSGRTNAAAALALALRRSATTSTLLLLTHTRSMLTNIVDWDGIATDANSATTLVETHLAREDHLDGLVVFVEGVADFAGSPAETSLVALSTRAKRGECLIVSEGESHEWNTSFGLVGALKSGRKGVVLAPDTHDGEMMFRTPFPTFRRREFPAGRAMYVHSANSVRVQLPFVLPTWK